MAFFRRSNRSGGAIEGIPEVESASKTGIKAKLIESIKDLQIEHGEGNPAKPIESNELTFAMVTALEALFIHGLKGQPTMAVNSHRRNLPEPSFWTFVLVFSHRETIHSIEKLSAVTTDIGRGRAWIRLALNDGLFGSYLAAMTVDKTTLRKYYQRHAILRDSDLMDIFRRYLSGIEIYRFELAVNSGLLNRWATGPLVLAGLWSGSGNNRALASEPPAAVAIDAASMLIPDNGLDPIAASTPATSSNAHAFEVIARPAGYLNRGLLNEDEALKLILAGGSPVTFSGSSSATNSAVGTPTSPLTMRKTKKMLKSSSNQRQKSPLPTEFKSIDDDGGSDKPHSVTSSSSERIISQLPSEPEPLAQIKDEILQSVLPNVEEIHGAQQQNNILAFPVDEEHKTLEKPVSPAPSNQEEEEEELIDIYRRRDSSSCSLEQEPMNNIVDDTSSSRYVTCPLIKDEDVDNLDDERDSKLDEAEKKTVVVKRPCYGISSSKSSSSAGSSLTLAAVPYLAGFIDSWNPFGSGRFFDTPPNSDGEEIKCGFSLKPNVQIGNLNQNDSQFFMTVFDKVVCEAGLDTQNYECAECTRAIGTIFGPAKICAYTKRYYCEECHVDDMSTIPAKIMFNWDFRKFRICRKARLFLNAVSIEPIIDVKSFNGELFNFAPCLNDVFHMRKQLRYMNAYLTTCADSKSQAKSTFKKMLWPRTYLYEEIDMFAIHDLEEVHSGRLAGLLTSAVKFARNHILNCLLCSGKGFICELCRQDQVIYPFDLDAIMQCSKCYTVFHLDCSIKMTNCPKCDRIEARNLNWHVSMSCSQRTVIVD